MHDPSFLALDIHLPIPMYDRWSTKNLTVRQPIIRRRTNAENLGQRIYPWYQLSGYAPRIGKYVFRWPTIIEVWHDERGGADMGAVCDYRARHNGMVRWLIEHRAHLRWKIIPYIRVRNWRKNRCEDCGQRFRWKEARFGTGWDAPGVLHDQCHKVRALRRQVADLAKYVRLECTETEAWRVRCAWLDDDAKSVQYYADLGVGRSAVAK